MDDEEYYVEEDEDDLAWLAAGIADAEAAGGVTLELYHRPGFGAGIGVRHRYPAVNVAGVDTGTYDDDA